MAKDQLKSTMKEVLKNPENATLTNVKTVYNSDSVCIIDFKCKALNGFGGYTTNAMEYVFCMDTEDSISHKKVFREAIVTIGSDGDYKQSIIERAEDTMNELNLMIKDKNKKYSRDKAIQIAAFMQCLCFGREVDNKGQKGDDIKL